jgi:hypothetical protein
MISKVRSQRERFRDPQIIMRVLSVLFDLRSRHTLELFVKERSGDSGQLAVETVVVHVVIVEGTPVTAIVIGSALTASPPPHTHTHTHRHLTWPKISRNVRVLAW